MDLLGVDIGGTFTDFVLLRDGQLRVHKLLSTPDDPARALLDGLATLGAPAALVHGTTVATNALLERRGAPTALITTAGFRDVLVIGRGDRPALYDLDVTRPDPLVPEAWRLELHERLDAHGAVVQPLSPTELAELVEKLAEGTIAAVAVCLLHAYANPAHEQAVLAALAPVAGLFVSASHQVLPEPREYERTSTTVVNAYVAPVLGRYLARLETALHAAGVASLRLMASDGGSMGLGTAHHLAARATLSGPAGGVVGARLVAGLAGFERIISFDMGGTSTDVALCDGVLPHSGESQVGGLPVRLPSIDIHTVGAGGGSLAWADAGGALRVGPQSAGASPGPACYGQGEQPTVTDANLLLGRLQPAHFLGQRMVLDADRAHTAVLPLATTLFGIADEATRLRAALGVVRVANAAMERAIRTISVERGYDPRDFVLVAFGGAGPLHAAPLAEALGIRRVLIPRFPGVLSALGMLSADVTCDASRALLRPLDALDLGQLRAAMAELAAEGLAALAADGEPAAGCRVAFALDLRYRGQSYELTTPLLEWSAEAGLQAALVRDDLLAAAARFHVQHERRYGHAMPTHPLEAVLLRARAVSSRPPLDLRPVTPHLPRTSPPAPLDSVPAALGDTPVLAATPLYAREALCPGDTLAGPAIVAQFDTTTIVPPGWHASVDGWGNLVLEALPGARGPAGG